MEIGAGLFCYHAGQRQQGDNVGESHQGIENISDGPHGGHRQIRADKDRGDIQPTITAALLPFVKYSRQRSP